ncbi:hypothetical protein, partial [uncultured Alistipes sp.]|uniref:hypothetical protein n=1 Tax=uncultured Alistipes sp. TaxID=538949 RepID=UPI0025E37562
CCRVPACRFLSPGFLPLVSRRRVLAVERLLPGSCCRFLLSAFPPQVSCRRVLVVERLLPGSCLSAFVAGFPAAGFPPQGSCR